MRVCPLAPQVTPLQGTFSQTEPDLAVHVVVRRLRIGICSSTSRVSHCDFSMFRRRPICAQLCRFTVTSGAYGKYTYGIRDIRELQKKPLQCSATGGSLRQQSLES